MDNLNIKHMACTMQVKTPGMDGVFTGYTSVSGSPDQQNEIVVRTLLRSRCKNGGSKTG